MSGLITVTMNLTERDVRNTEKLTRQLRTPNKAETISAVLSFISSLSDMLQGDEKELIIRDRKGNMEKIIIPGLTEKAS